LKGGWLAIEMQLAGWASCRNSRQQLFCEYKFLVLRYSKTIFLAAVKKFYFPGAFEKFVGTYARHDADIFALLLGIFQIVFWFNMVHTFFIILQARYRFGKL
jgi:hypothetical protein